MVIMSNNRFHQVRVAWYGEQTCFGQNLFIVLEAHVLSLYVGNKRTGEFLIILLFQKLFITCYAFCLLDNLLCIIFIEKFSCFTWSSLYWETLSNMETFLLGFYSSPGKNFPEGIWDNLDLERQKIKLMKHLTGYLFHDQSV